MYISIH